MTATALTCPTSRHDCMPVAVTAAVDSGSTKDANPFGISPAEEAAWRRRGKSAAAAAAAAAAALAPGGASTASP